jgi:prefoldin subunit 5
MAPGENTNVNRITSLIQQEAVVFLVLLFLLLTKPVQASLERAMAPLTEETPSKTPNYNTALRDANKLEPAARFVLSNHLLLRQGAQKLAAKDYSQSRQLLTQVETDSPSAIQASLLIAESYRLEQQPEQAKDWFLRTAHHYPYRTQTLSGLISAANDQPVDQTGLALALYNKAGEQADFALAQLQQLKSSQFIDPLAVIFPSKLDEQVRQAFLLRCLHNPDEDLLSESSRLQEAVSSLLYLQKQRQTLGQKLELLQSQLQDYQRQRQSLQNQLDSIAAQQRSLESQLIPNNLDDDQVRIRRQLGQLRNQTIRMDNQIAFIDRTRQQLPAMVDNLNAEIQQLHQQAMAQLKSSNQAVKAVLESSYRAYYRELRNLAAEAKLQHAERQATYQP